MMSVGNMLAPLRSGTGMGAAYLRLSHGMKVGRFALVLLGTSVAAALVNAVLAMVGMGLSYARSGWFNLPAVIAAGAVLAAEVPATYGGHVRKTWGVDPVFIDSQNPAVCLWEGAVQYGPAETERPEPELGETLLRSRSGGGTEHIVVPIARRGSYAPAGEQAPEAHGIGDDGEGHIEGVDIEAPRYEFTVTKVFTSPAGAPSEDTLRALADTVNDAEFSVTDSRTSRTIRCAAGPRPSCPASARR